MSEDRVTELLEELLTWTRFMARGQLEQSLGTSLKDPKHQLVYELTDGARTQMEIAAIAKIDQTTVSDLWGRWRRLGLVRDAGKRPRHLIRLSDIGWQISGLPTQSKGRSQSDSQEPSARVALSGQTIGNTQG